MGEGEMEQRERGVDGKGEKGKERKEEGKEEGKDCTCNHLF
jgi:hypothetical protein